MTLDFETETDLLPVPDPEGLAARVIGKALDVLECPYEAEVSLLLTDDEGIRDMNRRFRGIDSETDVLSFPMTDFPEEGSFDFLDDDAAAADSFHPETGELLLGDIVINVGRVLEQAEKYGHSPEREYAFLITHSVLHLCGYDHMEAEEEARMIRMQEAILDELGITR